MTSMSEQATQVLETEQPLAAPSLALLPRVNLLPPEIAERRAFRRVQLGLGGGVAAVLALMGALVVSANSGVAQANEELTAAQVENANLARQKANYSNVNAIYAAAAAAEAQLSTAMGDEVRFSQMMNDFSLAIPSTVWVTSVSMSASGGTAPAAGAAPTAVGSFTVSGMALSHNEVGVWLEAIAGLKSFSDPYFSSSSETMVGSRKVVTFSSTATINSAALSGRYTKPIGS